METECDAVIVGGGPAGSVVALQLARQGRSVLLVERGGRNREKTCGHCLNSRAVDLLERIDLREGVIALARGSTQGLRVHGDRNRASSVRLPRQGWIVPRSGFDQFLRDAAACAGATVLHDSAATRFEFDDRGATVSIRTAGDTQWVRTGLVVGADGLGSRVARVAGLTSPHRIRGKYGFSFDWNSPRRASSCTHEIAMFLHPLGGYLGVVQGSDGLIHVAGLIPAKPHSSLGSSREPFAWMRELAQRHEALKAFGFSRCDRESALNFHSIGPMPWKPVAIANQGVALVGDAAGYVEPFTGEGMTWAIQSALVLAESMKSAPGGTWNITSAHHYQRLWRETIGRRQRVCRGLSMILERPRMVQIATLIGERIPFLPRLVARQVVNA